MVKDMKKYIPYIAIIAITIILLICIPLVDNTKDNQEQTNELEVMIVGESDNNLVLLSNDDIIYTIEKAKLTGKLGDNVLITYTGIIDESTNILDVDIIDYSITPRTTTNLSNSNDIFVKYYEMASRKLQELTLDEKIGQLFLIRYDENTALNDLSKYKVSGFVFYEKDFKDKTESSVKKMINTLQNKSTIPMLTATDEEGGKIVRVSSNPNLVSKKFKSSRELYQTGGMNAIKEDTINKSKILKNLGINLNLAPVVDVSTNPSDYMYERTIGENSEITSTYAKTVITASKGTGISYTLKHFPGYGNNQDTHTTSSIDNRTYESIMTNDIPPFQAGIDAGAEAVLVSHNIVSSIDPDNEASLSPAIHNLLRNDLNFTGVIITDDISMGAISNLQDASVKAVLAGNNLIITSASDTSIGAIKTAINNNTISEELIDSLVLRVLAFKYYKGLMIDEK